MLFFQLMWRFLIHCFLSLPSKIQIDKIIVGCCFIYTTAYINIQSYRGLKPLGEGGYLSLLYLFIAVLR